MHRTVPLVSAAGMTQGAVQNTDRPSEDNMPDGEELEQIITEQIDRESKQQAILSLEIETLKKAVKQVENVSGLGECEGKGRND